MMAQIYSSEGAREATSEHQNEAEQATGVLPTKAKAAPKGRKSQRRTAPAKEVLPASRRQVGLLLGLAEKIEAQVESEARSRLWAILPLRRLGQTARALAEAHQRRDVPDILTR